MFILSSTRRLITDGNSSAFLPTGNNRMIDKRER